MKLSTIFNRSNVALGIAVLSLVIAAISIAFGVKAQMDERAIVAEMRRQVGNADATNVGWQYDDTVTDSDWRHDNNFPVSAWDMLREHNDKIKEIESRLEGLDEPEVELLGSDTFWNMARIYFIDGDLDNDGVKNGDDECPDISGNDDWFTGCPAPTDSDNDGVANYRDACPNQTIPEGRAAHDDGVMRGPRSLFPSDQGCAFSTAQPAAAAAPAAPVAIDTVPVQASTETWICDQPNASVQISGSATAGWLITCNGTNWSCGNKAANPDGTVTLNREDCTAK